MSQGSTEAWDCSSDSDEVEISFQDALCLSMDRIYRDHMKPMPFKVIDALT
jgi:hypothetical protein